MPVVRQATGQIYQGLGFLLASWAFPAPAAVTRQLVATDRAPTQLTPTPV